MPIASTHPKIVIGELLSEVDGWPHVVTPPLEGMVYELTNIDFDEYFDAPIRKRDL